MASLRTAAVAGGFAQSLAGVAGTLVATRAGHSEWTAGLPQTLLVLGSASAAVVLARAMRRHGRGVALARGGLVAVAGCLLGVGACLLASVAVLCCSSVLIGWGVCAVMFSRYAAVDLPGRRQQDAARLLSAVLTAVAIGAVVGPNLLAMTARLDSATGLPFGTIAYGFCAIGFLAAALSWRAGLTRAATAGVESLARPASHDVVRSGAIAVLAIANLVMVAVMTMAPVQMHDHDHNGLGVIGIVVSAHIGAMFAPSPVTGRAVEAIGERIGVFIGGVMFVGATATAMLAGTSMPVLAAAMVLLGAAWNLTTIAASSTLTRGSALPERIRREGLGEVGMGTAAALGGVSSGLLMSAAGYATLAAVALAVSLTALLPLARILTDSRSTSSLEKATRSP
jgi:MFS family permease